ncbi:MAG: O-antigen ligase family protein [Ignavibacteria bacterium]|nr:O-antigen ligase family protein [Ignavibacteria bacterium]
MLEYLAYGLAGIAMLSLAMLWAYSATGCKEICICLYIILLGTYNLSILPGGVEIRQYTFLLIAPLFIPYLIDFFRPEKFILSTASRVTIHEALLSIIFVSFMISVFAVNIGDLKNFMGPAKALVYLGGAIFYFKYLPEKLDENPEAWRFFNRVIVIIALITSVFGILFYFTGYNPNPSAIGASSSFYKHPNTSAFIYSFAAPILVYRLFLSEDHVSSAEKLFLTAGVVAVYLAMLLTLSRAGYIAVFISTSILIFLKSRKVFVVWLVTVVSAFALVLQSFLFSKGSASTLSRLGLIYSALEMLKSSNLKFLFGFGLVSVFEEFTNFKFQLGPLLEDVAYPHNSILFFIMQFGLVAFLPTIAFAGYVLFKSWKLILADQVKYERLIVPFTVVVSLMSQSLLEDTVLFPEFFVYHIFMIFLGYLFHEVIIKPARVAEKNSQARAEDTNGLMNA